MNNESCAIAYVYSLGYDKGKRYVGHTVNAMRRLRSHTDDLRKGEHSCDELQHQYDEHQYLPLMSFLACIPYEQRFRVESFYKQLYSLHNLLANNTPELGHSGAGNTMFGKTGKAHPTSGRTGQANSQYKRLLADYPELFIEQTWQNADTIRTCSAYDMSQHLGIKPKRVRYVLEKAGRSVLGWRLL